MSDIFISYASEDLERVRPLADALERQGWEVWWDRESIPAGEVFDEFIEEALNAAKSIVVVWTTTSVKSHWVRGEAAIGLDRKVLVPVLFEPQPFKPPLSFRQIHGAELFDWNGDESSRAFQKLIADLTRAIGATPQAPTVEPGETTMHISAPPVTVHISEPPAAKPESSLRVRVHRAVLEGDAIERFFVNVVNRSADHPVELTHVWYQGSKRVDIVEPARPLPKLLRPSESWETYVSGAVVPPDDNPFQNFRVRTSTEEVIASRENVDVPPRGFVPGGPIAPPPPTQHAAPRQNYTPSSFFATDGSLAKNRADNFVRFLANPRTKDDVSIDRDVQRSFRWAIRKTFHEAVGFDREIKRGKYYQVESDAAYRSSSHRVWLLEDTGMIGYAANLDTNREVKVGDVALHYIFFVRLCETVFSPPRSIDLSFTLTCPSTQLVPFVPGPDSERDDYDQVNVGFNQGGPYLPESDTATSTFDLTCNPEALARLVFRQLQETTGAEAKLDDWIDWFRSLSTQTSAPAWGMLP